MLEDLKSSPQLKKSLSQTPYVKARESSSVKLNDSDPELNKSISQKEDRGFATDLLKLPSFSSTYFANSLENVGMPKKASDKSSASFKHKFVTKQFILDALDEIIDIWY